MALSIKGNLSTNGGLTLNSNAVPAASPDATGNTVTSILGATTNYKVDSVTMTNAGSGYTNPPDVIFSDSSISPGPFGGPSNNARGTAVLNADTVASVTIDDVGKYSPDDNTSSVTVSFVRVAEICTISSRATVLGSTPDFSITAAQADTGNVFVIPVTLNTCADRFVIEITGVATAAQAGLFVDRLNLQSRNGTKINSQWRVNSYYWDNNTGGAKNNSATWDLFEFDLNTPSTVVALGSTTDVDMTSNDMNGRLVWSIQMLDSNDSETSINVELSRGFG